MEEWMKFRRFENLHIVFWLVKDACWLMEWRIPGTLMVLPTVALAFYISVKTAGSREFWLNLAILCWITANSFWMLMEFYNDSLYCDFAALPFGIGFIAICVYYWRKPPAIS